MINKPTEQSSNFRTERVMVRKLAAFHSDNTKLYERLLIHN